MDATNFRMYLVDALRSANSITVIPYICEACMIFGRQGAQCYGPVSQTTSNETSGPIFADWSGIIRNRGYALDLHLPYSVRSVFYNMVNYSSTESDKARIGGENNHINSTF